MGKLDLIEKLHMAAWSGEMVLLKDYVTEMEEIREVLYAYAENQILGEITDRNFGFYAPEYASWSEALLENNKSQKKDYAVILHTKFTEEELSELWELSHIAGQVTDEYRLQMLYAALRLMKQYESMSNAAYGQKDHVHTLRKAKAILAGIYNSAGKGAVL